MFARAVAAGGRTAVVVGLALVVVLATTEGRAGAHTVLESSSPTAEASVGSVSVIELRFTEPILADASHIYVEDPVGFIELPNARPIDGDAASLAVAMPPLGDGTYAVTWHVVATDGDPAQGTFSFTIDPALATAATTAVTLADPAADFPPDTSMAIPLDQFTITQQVPTSGHGHGPGAMTEALARIVLDLGVTVLVGGFAFLAIAWPKGARVLRMRQLLIAAGGLAILASLELTAFQNAAVTGLSTLEGLAPWHQVDALGERFGRIAAVRLLLLIAALATAAQLADDGPSRVRSTRWRVQTAAIGLGLLQTLVLLGHAQSSGLVPSAARLLHVAGISVWLGGLVVLLTVVLPRGRGPELLGVLPRFSAMATAAVAGLVAGGVVLSIDLVGGFGALTATTYGRLLLLKVALVVGVVSVASKSRHHVRTSLGVTEAEPSAEPLVEAEGALLVRTRATRSTRTAAPVVAPIARWVAIEVGLLAVVLVVTALLLTKTPPA